MVHSLVCDVVARTLYKKKLYCLLSHMDAETMSLTYFIIDEIVYYFCKYISCGTNIEMQILKRV